MPFRFGGEFLDKKSYTKGTYYGYQHNKWTPWARRGMDVRIINYRQFSQEQQVMEECDKVTKCDGSQPGNYSD